MNQKILITGGGGFIGRNLIAALRDRYSIICLDQRTIGFYSADVQCVRGTFSDRELVRSLLFDVDVVVHLGSNALPANADYVSDVEQNLLGSIALIKECENAGVKKIVFASSGGTVYGPDAPTPTPETAPRNPICSYGIIKSAVEDYLALATRLTGISTVSLRISNPYGPWQNWNSPQGAVAVFCHKILNRESIVLFGDGAIRRDFVYIGDVINAFENAIARPIRSGAYNIGSGVPVSLKELISALALHIGVRPIVNVRSSRGCDVPCSCLDVTKARKELGWFPMTTFADGIERIVDWQRNNQGAF